MQELINEQQKKAVAAYNEMIKKGLRNCGYQFETDEEFKQVIERNKITNSIRFSETVFFAGDEPIFKIQALHSSESKPDGTVLILSEYKLIMA